MEVNLISTSHVNLKKTWKGRRAYNTQNVTKSTCFRKEEAKKKNSELRKKKKNLQVRHVADVTQCYLHVSIILPNSYPPPETQMQKRPCIGVQVFYISYQQMHCLRVARRAEIKRENCSLTYQCSYNQWKSTLLQINDTPTI